MDNKILFSKDEQGVAKVTLNMPERHNAIGHDVIRSLTQILYKIEEDPEIRVVVLSSVGESFCAGADIAWMQNLAEYSMVENLADAADLAELMKTLHNLGKPTIALVNGPAYGGGVGLVACADMAIASPKASFCLSEVKYGLIPSVISPYVIAAIGERAARHYFLTAEVFNEAEALRLGLVTSVVPEDELTQKGEILTKRILHNSPAALVSAKRLINRVVHNSIDDELIQETAQRLAEIRVSPEGQEGLRSFLEKRKPNWVKS